MEPGESSRNAQQCVPRLCTNRRKGICRAIRPCRNSRKFWRVVEPPGHSTRTSSSNIFNSLRWWWKTNVYHERVPSSRILLSRLRSQRRCPTDIRHATITLAPSLDEVFSRSREIPAYRSPSPLSQIDVFCQERVFGTY